MNMNDQDLENWVKYRREQRHDKAINVYNKSQTEAKQALKEVKREK